MNVLTDFSFKGGKAADWLVEWKHFYVVVCTLVAECKGKCDKLSLVLPNGTSQRAFIFGSRIGAKVRTLDCPHFLWSLRCWTDFHGSVTQVLTLELNIYLLNNRTIPNVLCIKYNKTMYG